MFRAANHEPIPMRRTTFVALAAAAAVGGPPRVAANAGTSGASSFAESVAAIEAIIARDRSDPLLAETSLPRFYHHGGPVRDAVVLYHGFTNCPQQFDELARALHARGCNVYVPRIPFHGYRDRLTRALSELSTARLADASTASYQLARDLGSRVSAIGLSLGGSMALYLAQTQPIDHAIPIAPFLMPIGFPGWLGMPVMSAIARLPDFYMWWDPRVKQNCLPAYAYPGFPTHALAACIFFGNGIVQSRTAPLGRRCTLVTNAHESAVNNAVADGLLATWKAHGAAYDGVVLDDLGAPRHDIIDPTTFPEARTLVYPRLESIVLD